VRRNYLARTAAAKCIVDTCPRTDTTPLHVRIPARLGRFAVVAEDARWHLIPVCPAHTALLGSMLR
jgi:hypothetical protein